MTKRILALVIAALMMVAAFASCTSTPATKTPAATTKAPETKAPETKAPETKPATAPATEPATAPVTGDDTPGTDPATDPGDEDIFAQFGGQEMMVDGEKYGGGFELWPTYDGSKEWAPCAFLQGTFTLNKDDIDATEGMGTADYQYRFVFYFMELTEEDSTEWKGPYTATCLTMYDFGNGNVIYRPLVNACPEGNLLDNFHMDTEYYLVMQVTKGDENLGFMFCNFAWDQKLDNSVKYYNYFWEQHNRDNGFTANDGVAFTDADYAKAEELGFKKEVSESLGNNLVWAG